MFYMLFAAWMKIIFDISTSNNVRISNIYAKNSRKGKGSEHPLAFKMVTYCIF